MPRKGKPETVEAVPHFEWVQRCRLPDTGGEFLLADMSVILKVLQASPGKDLRDRFFITQTGSCVQNDNSKGNIFNSTFFTYKQEGVGK